MTKPSFLPWWQCSALVLDGDDEIDLDIEVRAATAGEAEDVARAEWADHGIDVNTVKTSRLDTDCADA